MNEKAGKDMLVLGNVLAVLAAAMFGIKVAPGTFTGACVAWILMGSALLVGRGVLFITQRTRLTQRRSVPRAAKAISASR